MHKMIPRSLLVVFASFISMLSFAQDKMKPEMADTMRSNGKIYVVVTVCLIILIGLFIYVMILDRKIRKMEKGDRGS